MALGELLAVRAEDHRDVREDRHGHVERLVDHDLARGVGQVVVAADDVRDAHEGVVDDRREVVGGGSVGAEDDEVVELLGIEDDLAVHRVVNHDVAAVERHLDADGVGLAGVDARLRGGGVDGAAGALVALEGVLARPRRLSVGLELLGGAEAVVGPALGDELLGSLAVDAQALRLSVRAEVAALVGALVPVEAQPTHGTKDDLGVLVGRAGRVGVVDAEDERAVVGTGERPVVNRGARTAHVEFAGGGGCEAHADGLVRQEVLLRARGECITCSV